MEDQKPPSRLAEAAPAGVGDSPGPPPFVNKDDPTEKEEDATSNDWRCLWWRLFLSVSFCVSVDLVTWTIHFLK